MIIINEVEHIFSDQVVILICRRLSPWTNTLITISGNSLIRSDFKNGPGIDALQIDFTALVPCG
ncbi:MAG: hypothetical protein VX603_19720 [Gemmatimonadota bacterium]|nr:hypothetical protein [Gemmatimonadota bacterium]